MVSLLAKLFIKDYKNTSSENVRKAYGMLCGALGIFLNVILFALKFFAGIVTASVAITADAFNNLSDAGSSLVSLIGFKLAGQEPDKEHPFGHGRIEYISSFIISMLILLMGFELFKTSFKKLFAPEEIVFSPIVLIILVASILTKFYMCFYNKKTGELISSASMKATAADSLGDTVSTGVVLISTLISHFFNINIDSYCGLAVACFILYTGFTTAKDTISPLLGNPPAKELVDKIYSLVLAHPEISGIHDLIVHDYGPGRLIISLHAEVPASGDILALHDTIDNIEHELSHELGCLAVIHMDPIDNSDEFTLELKSKIRDFVKNISPELTIHDFRIVKGPTHTNIIFDIVVPPKFRLKNEELRSKIADDIKSLDESYNAVIEIDREYTTSAP